MGVRRRFRWAIGDQCIVGARAVVIKNVEDNSIVAGNPAKPIAKSSNATAPNIETI
jgi:acetyltransferase-like isoleucine patch superfamily enzyme